MSSRPPTLLVRFSTLSATPWANGPGRTTELVSWAASRALSGATTAAWRLSIAELAGEAAFSPLPGVRRLFVPVGTAVTLLVNGDRRRVADRTAIAFSGDDAVELVELDRRPGHAVNLMYRTTGDGDPATGAPGLVVGRAGDQQFAGCLVAVALDNTAGVDRFDVLSPGGLADLPNLPDLPVLPDLPDLPDLPVVMVTATG